MDILIGNGVINIVANTTRFTNSINELSKKISTENIGKEIGRKLADSIGKGLVLGGGAILGGLLAITKKPIDMAMEAVESENLFEVSMGKYAEQARKWSLEISESLGLNDYEVRKNVATFNAMLTSMGLSEQKAYEMSTALTQLAYDISSFYNLRPEEAFEKIRAGISGETEPLKALGINLLDNEVKQYAVEKGLVRQIEKRDKHGRVLKDEFGNIKKVTEQLDEQTKVLARFGLLMERTQKAQGDLFRTKDSPANQVRIMREELEKIKIDFGISLLPVAKDVMDTVLKPLLNMIKGLVEWWKSLPEGVRTGVIKTVATLGILSVALGGVISIGLRIFELVNAFRTLFAVIKGATFLPTLLNPIGVAVLGIGLAAFLVVKYWKPILNFFRNLLTNISGFFKNHTAIIMAVLFPFVGIPLLLIKNWNSVKTTFINVVTSIKTAWSNFVAHLEALKEKVIAPFRAIIEWIQNLSRKWTDFKASFSLPKIQLPSWLGGSKTKNESNNGNKNYITINQKNTISNEYDYAKFNNRTIRDIRRGLFAF